MEYRIKDPNYIEGYSTGEILVKNIESSKYLTIEHAILVKKNLLSRMEKELGFSEENPHPDYMLELGLFDALIKSKNDRN